MLSILLAGALAPLVGFAQDAAAKVAATADGKSKTTAAVPGTDAESAANTPAPKQQQIMVEAVFVEVPASTAAALGLTLCGVTAMVPDPPPIELASLTFGPAQMNDRVLVAYASFAGSTKEVAADIGRTLGERGFSAHFQCGK